MGRNTKTSAATKKTTPKPPPVKRTRSAKAMDEDVICLSGNEDMENPPVKKNKNTTGGRVAKDHEMDECFTTSRCLTWFQSYATCAKTPRSGKGKSSAEFSLDRNGMEKLYGAIGVDSADILALILSQKLGVLSADSPVSQTQWMNFMTIISCDSDKRLQAYLPKLLEESKSRTNLLNLCQYLFTLVLQPGQKAVEKDVAVELFSMIMKSSWSVYPVFAKFLASSDVRGVTLDTFSGLCDISLKYPTVNAMRHYDASQAWPSMADDFAEWLKVEVREEHDEEA